MTTETPARSRLFTRDDGRDRIAFPFAKGILSALAAVGIQLGVTFVLVLILAIAAYTGTHKAPSINPGDPFILAIELLSYVFGGWFAWSQLRRGGRTVFRRLSSRDVRTILYGVGALIVVRIATGLLLAATHQTNHVQTGFEHFDVTSKVPGVTALAIALTVLTAVVVAPLVEEIVFRGLLFGAFAARTGVLAGAFIVALLFGAAHVDVVLFPTLAALGFISALAYAASGNLWTSVTLHALNNAVGAAALIAMTYGHHGGR
jgi:membrane protease YdiL (CAAX protease family)